MTLSSQSRLFAPVTKRIVLLADSPHRSGYQCLAGREVQWERAALRSVGPWIRLISPTGTWRQHDVRFESGALPRLCDLVDVPLEYTSKHPVQPEDRMVAPEFRWTHVGRLSPAYLNRIQEEPATLWHARRRNPNRIAVADVQKIAHLHSIVIIRPLRPQLTLWTDPPKDGHPPIIRRRVRFQYHGTEYELPIVDRRIVDDTMDAPPVGAPPRVTEALFAEDCLFTVNLTTPIARFHHKVIVGVVRM